MDQFSTSDLYENKVNEFYHENFRPFSGCLNDYTEEKESLLKEFLSIFITNDFYVKNKHTKLLRIRILVKSVMRSYTLPVYKRLMKLDYFQEFILLLNKNGMVDEILSSYPKMMQSRRAYEDLNNSIIDSYLTHH